MEASLTFERDKMRMLRIILWLMGIIDKAGHVARARRHHGHLVNDADTVLLQAEHAVAGHVILAADNRHFVLAAE